MLNSLEILHNNRELFDIAMGQALEDWERLPFDVDHPVCPDCQSQDINISRGRPGRRSYRCRGCNHLFYESTDLTCDCDTPGTSPKCQECINYQRLMFRVRQKVQVLKEGLD